MNIKQQQEKEEITYEDSDIWLQEVMRKSNKIFM